MSPDPGHHTALPRRDGSVKLFGVVWHDVQVVSIFHFPIRNEQPVELELLVRGERCIKLRSEIGQLDQFIQVVRVAVRYCSPVRKVEPTSLARDASFITRDRANVQDDALRE